MNSMEQVPEFARGHQLGKLARRSEPEYADDGAFSHLQDHVAQEGDYDADTEFVDDPDQAEVILSLVDGPGLPKPEAGAPTSSWAAFLKDSPKHRPIIDIDFPVAVLPSSTPGHHHLYIDKELTWNQYRHLLQTLRDVGIIEPGYFDASYARQFTSVRLPWIRKVPNPPVPEPKEGAK